MASVIDAPAAGPVPGTFSSRIDQLGTENAFKVGPYIRQVEERGRKVVKCNLGEPDFPLPAHIRDEVKRQLDADNTHYSDPQGILPLREAIARQMGPSRGLALGADRVVVFPGAKTPIGFCQEAYCEPGDEVLFPSPGFPIYESFTQYLGVKPVPYHLDEATGFGVSADDLARLITPRTKLIFINFPSNPTGGVASREQLQSIADVILSKCRPDVRVYSDEVYEAILFDGAQHVSIASLPGMAERTVLVSGVSKTYSWTGGRIGWAVFPTVAEAQVFKNLNINYFSCLPAYNQAGARLALESPLSAPEIRRMVAAFQERRDFVVAALNRIPGVRCQMPRGAFYVFPNVAGVCERLGIAEALQALPPAVRERTTPSTLLQMFLLFKYALATMDRKSFGRIGAEGRHYLRISIATSLPDLKEGLSRFEQAAADRAGFAEWLRCGDPLY